MPTNRLWGNAQHDAVIIMGTRPRVRGDRGTKCNAVEDPLAWWCLVELLVAYGEGKKS
jgi:hypothetical protein